jgi:xanthine/CO dehydrogenase XdhC/CoxF family maturation factor
VQAKRRRIFNGDPPLNDDLRYETGRILSCRCTVNKMLPVKEITTRLIAQDAVLVRVDASQGSVPRETGAWMAVFSDAVIGTVGGGHLELQAIEEARRRLSETNGDAVLRYPLGPALGQCCGGVVHLRFDRLTAADAAGLPQKLRSGHAPVALFGGGACLKRLRERGDLPYVGLIGSKTKWATFRHRLEERGFRKQELAQVTCPIGVPGVAGKEPEVIAVAVAAQLLQAPLP